jgi:hypothetical protein
MLSLSRRIIKAPIAAKRFLSAHSPENAKEEAERWFKVTIGNNILFLAVDR